MTQYHEDSNITEDYVDNNYAYADEDDYLLVSPAEVQCHEERLAWEEARDLGRLTQPQCPPFWDKISCWRPVSEGVTASLPCPAEFRGIAYDTSKSAFLDCLESSGSTWPLWANKSNYTACVPRSPNVSVLETGSDSLWGGHYEVYKLFVIQNIENLLKVLSHIYLVGYSVSLVALLVATTIFIYFKEMRCLRNKIHANLFLTFILTNSCWITTSVMTSLQHSSSSLEVSWCVSLVFSRYFHLATFFWMFVEGLFLFVQVIATFSVEDSRMKFRHYFLIGWGLPLIVVCIWAVFTQSKVLEERQKMLLNNTQPHHQCPFMEATSHEWIYMGPVFLLLTTNAFFLVSIFWVVVTKLRSNGSTSETTDHQNWRAAKALLVIIPLLGITYLITIVGPSDKSSLVYLMFVHVRAVLLSTQGLTVTLPYCFLNTEVKGILQHHWKRWRNTRNVEHNYSRGHSARNSISLAGYYACDSNSTFLSASRRNSFMRLHSMYLSGSQGAASHRLAQPGHESSHLVTSVLLERCGDSAVRHSNRIIPVIQEETVRTPSPSTFPPPVSPVASTMISVTPATPTPGPHSPVPEPPASLAALMPGCGSGTLSPDELSCYSTHSTPINRCSTRDFLDAGDVQGEHETSSLLDLGVPDASFHNKSLSSCTLPSQQPASCASVGPHHNGKMPDILNFPSSPIPGTFSVSCPSIMAGSREPDNGTLDALNNIININN